MAAGFLHRFDAALARDAQLAAATRHLAAAVGTADWPMAERGARAATHAALRRALWRAAAGGIPWRRAERQRTAPARPAPALPSAPARP